MDSNMTFRLDADVKEQMSAICKELGMTTSTAFNLFARAFVRAKGMPFDVTIQTPTQGGTVPHEQMMADAGQVLEKYHDDYMRMAE